MLKLKIWLESHLITRSDSYKNAFFYETFFYESCYD